MYKLLHTGNDEKVKLLFYTTVHCLRWASEAQNK